MTTVPVYLLLGEGNMQGRAPIASLPAALTGVRPGIFIWRYLSGMKSFVPLQGGVSNCPDESGNPQPYFGPEMQLLEHLRAYHGSNVYAIKFAPRPSFLGSSPSDGLQDSWWPDRPHLFADLKTMVDEALLGPNGLPELGLEADVRGVFWMQGESDATLQGNSLAYETSLRYLVTSVREFLAFRGLVRGSSDGARLHWCSGKPQRDTAGEITSRITLIRNAIEAAGTGDGHYSTADVPGAGLVDAYGLDAAGVVALGTKMFEGFRGPAVTSSFESPTFFPSVADLKPRLRLSGVPKDLDGQQLILEAIRTVKTHLIRRIGATRLAFLKALPASELLRQIAEATEIKWVRKELISLMQAVLLDGSSDRFQQWNNEAAFRSMSSRQARDEAARLDDEIEFNLQSLSGSVAAGDETHSSVSVNQRDDFERVRPGDSINFGGVFR